MLNDACDHAMSRLNAFLTPRVLQPFPPLRKSRPKIARPTIPRRNSDKPLEDNPHVPI